MEIIIVTKQLKNKNMVYKYTSSREVIAKIYSDLDFQEELHRISDIREWITEAVEKIGAFDQFVKKVVELPVHHFKVRLPDDFHSMVQCAYSFNHGHGSWVPMRVSTGSFECADSDHHMHHMWNNNPSSFTGSPNIMKNLLELIKATYSVGTPITDATAQDILDKLLLNNGAGDVYGVMPILLSMINTSTVFNNGVSNISSCNRFEPVYRMNGGYVHLNIRGGCVKMSYQALMVDDDGFPMIPDIASYKEALYWYVTMKLKFPEWMSGRMRGDVYMEIKKNWHLYRQQAYGHCIMPNADEMQSLQNVWLRQIPELGEHDTFFKTAGSQQQIYDKNGPSHRHY
jgi:hypothetical protein